MVPESVVASIATELNLRRDAAEDLIGVVGTGKETPEDIRRLADAHAWTYNETAFLLERVRRRLVEQGYLEDPRVAQEIRYGAPPGFVRATGPVGTAIVEDEGGAHERVRVGVIVGRVPGLQDIQLVFTYPRGAPRYDAVKAALLAGGAVRIWSPPSADLFSATSSPRIWQLEREGQVVVWYADTAPYFAEGDTSN